MSLHLDLTNPIPLDFANFTPITRTPWGGSKILQLKGDLCPEFKGKIVGESWEFSCEPSFPSQILGSDKTLIDCFNNKADCNLLIKIIDTSLPLSIQVHPDIYDSNLKFDQSGKSESWFILDAKDGAGVYLGFKDPYSKDNIRDGLKENKDFHSFFQFVPVKKGDFIDIPPGVFHAIGAGVTLLEPQYCQFNKKSVTYRLWDWNRRYDLKGCIDLSGKVRELHVEEALSLIDSEKQYGSALVNSLFDKGKLLLNAESSSVLCFEKSKFYRTHSINLAKNQELTAAGQIYGALFVTAGNLNIKGTSNKSTYWQKGQSGLIAKEALPISIRAMTNASFVIVTTNEGSWDWSFK